MIKCIYKTNNGYAIPLRFRTLEEDLFILNKIKNDSEVRRQEVCEALDKVEQVFRSYCDTIKKEDYIYD